MDVVRELWRRLKTVSKFEYRVATQSGSKTGWDGVANGSVEVRFEDDWVHFSETCLFTPDDGSAEMSLRNEYRWTNLDTGISLEHRRREDPVHLVDLIPVQSGEYQLTSKAAHLCGADVYSLNIRLLESDAFEAEWKICGPKKNEVIFYRYF